MARTASVEQFIAVLMILRTASDAMSASDVAASLTPPVAERTVRAWLDALVAEGRVKRTGEYRWTRYALAPGGLSGLGVEELPVAPAGVPRGTPPVPPVSPPALPVAPAVASARTPVAPTGRPPALVPVAPVAPPPPPPAPAFVVTPRDRAKFKRYLDELVPLIVTNELKRLAGLGYAQTAAEGLPDGDDERFLAVIEAELDGLDAVTSAAYGIDPAAFTRWKRRWYA